MKNFKNIFTLLVEPHVGLSLTGCSEDDLDTNPYGKSGVNLVGFGPSPILRTQEIRITGTNMTNVTKVVFPGDAAVEKSGFNRVDNENIYVNVPDESVPGHISLMVGNDIVAKSASLLTFEEPIEVTSVTPMAGLNAGDEITIKGDYVYNIAEVVFTCGVSGAPVPAEEFTYVSRREIRLRVPLAAETGTITMNDGAKWELEWKEPLEILSATVTGVTPSADFGQQITITGTNLHTVETVMFAGGVAAEFSVSDDHNSITVTVPDECRSGVINLVLFSGATLTTDEFSVPTVTVTEVSKGEDLVEGDVVTLTGENFDRIKEVRLPGVGTLSADQYTISGNTLTFTVPAEMTDGDGELVQNAYITTTFALSIRKLEGVVWQGKADLSGWSNWGVFNWDGDLWKRFQEAFSGPGQLTLHFVVTNDNPMYKIRMGDWATRLSGAAAFESEDGGEWIIHPNTENPDLVIDLTAEEVQAMFSDGGKGIVVWGDGLQLQYVKYIVAGAERTIWSGNEDLCDGHQPDIGSDAGAEFIEIGAHAGQICRFYITPSADDWWFQVFEGHWGPMYGEWKGETHAAEVAATGCVKLELTQAMIDAALTQQWWGGIFVVQGSVTLTKVTVANL